MKTKTNKKIQTMKKSNENVKAKTSIRFSRFLFNIATKNLLFNQIYLIIIGLSISKTRKLQGSIEYIMILSAVTIIVIIALSMMTQLKGTVLHSFYNSTTNQSASQLLAHELKNLSKV